MSLWRRTSSEVAGAWRSVRYDMGRRPPEPPADGPDVTSTGMNTFGGTAWGYEPAPPARTRPARRAALVSAFGLLTVLGAAAAYLVVVNGLVPLRDEKPAAAGTLPAAAPTVTADSGLGPSTRRPRRHAPVETIPAPGAAAPVAAVPPTTVTRPLRTVKPTSRECLCGNPPVPTPTAPASAPSATPSAPASPSNSPSASPSGGSPSGTPSESPEPHMSRKAGHHRHPR